MRPEIRTFLLALREEILSAFQSLEGEALFVRTPWDYSQGRGGGEMALVRGEVFEKGAVHFSEVAGDTYPLDGKQGPFFATGVSLITHMKNPHAPTVHFNLRYIETKQGARWGGGFDLTPMGEGFEEDRLHFHRVAEEALAPFGKTVYREFAEAATRYFYIPHRQRERGVGGLFFDDYTSGDPARDFALWKAVGRALLPAILPIYAQRTHQTYTIEERALQLKRRGHYAEFNLVYDKGTRFGLLSGGNIEAIFSSLPPLASW